ncbi:Polypeptide N-acetylgalactosaminyltransferase 2 [Phytophthora nicotianae]|uniref:Polypeptide N-acetylgalactosaminyltransferase 2 n=1 Tax=Phytophthora nicotianae TaxID=4792 RepID=A0A0W8DCL6_PHYNI|nr:Polypeptide N-acetylgalactosaminyltransferase 2 [Phytophthora nicotianae]
MGGAASVDCASNSNYRYGEAPEVQGDKVNDDTSWIGTKLDMPPKPFSVENYFELLDIVGTGMLGKVRLVRHKRSSLYYVLKSVKKKDVIAKKMIPQLEAERDAMEQMTAIRHPFSVLFFGSLATSSHVHFLLEYIPGGELFHRIHAVGRLSNDEAKFYATELVVFIEACHTNHFMYRDLKPENILLDASGHLKIVDFGFVKRLHSPNERTSSSVGTPEYLAPEQLTVSHQARNYSRIVDWWAFACVVYEMVIGSPPFTSRKNESHFELYTRILSGKIYWPRFMQSTLKDLLRNMLQSDPGKRLSEVDAIKQHAWFENVDWDAVPLKQVPARSCRPWRVRATQPISTTTPAPARRLHGWITTRPGMNSSTFDKDRQHAERCSDRFKVVIKRASKPEVRSSVDCQRSKIHLDTKALMVKQRSIASVLLEGGGNERVTWRTGIPAGKKAFGDSPTKSVFALTPYFLVYKSLQHLENRDRFAAW